MHYKSFDTHKYVKSLQESGFNEKQAEVLVKSLLESRDFDLSILATREQVSEVKSELQKEIAEVKNEIVKLDNKLSKEIAATREQISEVKYELQKEIAATRDEIKQSKVDMLKWMLPLMSTMMAMMLAIIVKLFL